jgi:NaMN:DMB phosphoribosyltransferase
MNYKITGIDPKLLEDYQGRLDNLTKPFASLGRLEKLTCPALDRNIFSPLPLIMAWPSPG